MATLIRVDRNGTKYYEGNVPCSRCDGKGIYYIGVHNGKPLPSWVDQGICFKCGGSGVQHGTWKEYTPEYEAKLEARRKAKREKWEQEHAEEIAKAQAEFEAKEAERKRQEEETRLAQEEEARKERELKAKSQYVGEIGDKLDLDVVLEKRAWFSVPSFYNKNMTETIYVFTFRDEQGNALVWKTNSGTSAEKGETLHLKGTIKEHKEYDEEKQTVLTRCRISRNKA